MEDVQSRIWRGALENHVKQVVFAETPGGVVFVGGESDVAGVRAAFDFDEANVNRRFRVLRMRFSTMRPSASSCAVATRMAMRSISGSVTIGAIWGEARSGCGRTQARPRC